MQLNHDLSAATEVSEGGAPGNAFCIRPGVGFGYRARSQRGSVLILVALSLVALVASVGLAVDSGVGYLAKAKLAAAVDGAALAAGKVVKTGMTESERKDNARAAATAFFNANYPNGTLGTTPTLESVDVGVATHVGGVPITVTASARGRVSFMRILGFDQQVVRASANVMSPSDPMDLALLVDHSGSIRGEYNIVKDANLYLLTLYAATFNRLSIIRFSTGATVMLPINKVAEGYDAREAELQVRSNTSDWGWTETRTALNTAVAELRSVTGKPHAQAILLFTDGEPTEWAGLNPPRRAAQQAADAARALGITVFTAGFGRGLNSSGQDFLRCLANAPDAPYSCRQPSQPVGAFCMATTQRQLMTCYNSLISQALKLTQ